MSGARLRAAGPGDGAALRALWREVFRDEDTVIEAFFDCLYAPEDTLLAEADGELVSAAYLLRGVELCAGEKRLPAAYFYALATLPEYRGRGLGRAVTRGLLEASAARGETLCLMPGEESLRRWYAGFAGLRSFGTARELVCAAAASPALCLTEIGPDEYARRREALLAGVPHAALPETIFRFQEKLCRLGGGALLRLRGERGAEGLACVSPEAGEARVPELLWTGDAEEAAAALAARFGAARCVARAPGEGLKTVMGAEKTLREPFWWGPVFD